MDIRFSSPKKEPSPSDSFSDPEEKEVSDDDDDDRNHKHRRRETLSQSLERDSLEQVLARQHRSQNKPLKNGNSYRGAGPHSNGTWRNYNMSRLDKDFSGKFDKGHPGLAPVSRAPFDLNQRIRGNQLWSGDPGFGRGRGKNPGSWNEHDSRFSSVDFAGQMVLGSGSASLFSGRGMPPVSSAQSAPWNAFSLVPGLPNGGSDTYNSLGLRRTLRGPINSSISVGIPRQRCGDFEERGFCLRGDMCPLEHGVNRIVVDDVQSLSQFNLPVSLPSAHFLGAPAASVPVSSFSAPSSTLGNSKGLFSKSGKSSVIDDVSGSNGDINGSSVASAADFYDPDQPLWSNDCSETATGLLAPVPAKVNGANDQPILTDDQDIRLYDDSDNELHVKNSWTAMGSHRTSSSVWGRIGSSKNTPDMREKIDCRIDSSDHTGNTVKDDQELRDNAEGGNAPLQKVETADNVGQHAAGSSLKNLNDTARNFRKLPQKAQRTLFVNNIPQKNNKKDSLLSHFQKFGEVVNIYIPVNSERAFVQFSKREEAENALKAPDAVMGNRFIKLWWANRDNIADDGMSSRKGIPPASRVLTAGSVPDCPAVFDRGRDAPQATSLKGSTVHASVSPVPASHNPKPVAPLALTQKKLENLEFLKEELRKKQEMLDKKRNDFKRKLDQLEKQATGLKGEVAVEQSGKRHKVGIVADAVKAATSNLVTPGTVVESPRVEMPSDRSGSGENVLPCSPRIGTAVEQEEPSSLRPSIRPLAPAGATYGMNRFKLDNRPTSFKISPPLPIGLANVALLKEHFSTYGELSSVELEDLDLKDSSDDLVTSNTSARVDFATRHSAESAFLNGKCWKGHNMKFVWLTSCNSNNNNTGKENPSSSSSKVSSDANVEPGGEVVSTGSQKPTISTDGESEVSERRETGIGHVVPDEELDSSTTAMSSENKSPEHLACSEGPKFQKL